MSLDLGPTLQNLLIALAGGAVPLVIYLFSRRAQLRQLNTTSDASIVTSAATFVTQLQAQIQVLTERLARLDGERAADRTNFVEQLNRAHEENGRVSVMVAQLKTDIDIANRQIMDLREARTRRDQTSS